jgi:hypothetical protein
MALLALYQDSERCKKDPRLRDFDQEWRFLAPSGTLPREWNHEVRTFHPGGGFANACLFFVHMTSIAH